MTALWRAFYLVCYYLSWVWFGSFSLVLACACALLFAVPDRERTGIAVRKVIRSLFQLWAGWFHATGVLRIEWEGFDEPLSAGTVYIANHPTLLDATFVLSRLPDAICIMKESLARNPIVAPPAILGGYVTLNRSIDTVREAAAKVAAGRALLIFPEGTRTRPGALVGPIKPVFALIAERARAPVQLIVIRASKDLVPKGRPWWKPPGELPARMTFSRDKRWTWEGGLTRDDLTDEVERRMNEVLKHP